MVIKELFPTPILFHQVDSKLSDYVENLVVSRLNNLEKIDNLKTDFFKKNKTVKIEEISELFEEILKCKKIFEQNTNFGESSLHEFWVQDYSYNQTHNTHNHGRNQLSVVYWVRANQEAGNFVLFDPKPQQSIFNNNVVNHSKYTELYHTISPIKGGMIIFPSYINHQVKPGGPNCIRTTIAFNFYPHSL